MWSKRSTKNITAPVSCLFKHKAIWGKALLLLVILAIVTGGLTGFGCVRGLQAIGWSGVAVAGDTIFVGSGQGRLVAVSIDDDSTQWSESIQSSGSTSLFGCSACAAGQSGVPIYGTPAVAEDLGFVYIGAYTGKVYAFYSGSLQKKWVYPPEDALAGEASGTDRYLRLDDLKPRAVLVAVRVEERKHTVALVRGEAPPEPGSE